MLYGQETDFSREDLESSDRFRGWVLYDGTCGFCSRTVQWIHSLTGDRGFHFVPFQHEHFRSQLEERSLDPDRDIIMLTPSGEARVGVDAYREIIRYFWWGQPIYYISLLPGLRWMMDRIYRGIADNRHTFSNACGIDEEPSQRPSGEEG